MDACHDHGVSFWIECELLSGGGGWMASVLKVQNQLSEVELEIFSTPNCLTVSRDVFNMTYLS